MISQLSMWQIVVDLCLVTSIFVMAFRGIKASRIQGILPQAIQLEVSLRKAIAEAENAARHVNDMLLRREQNLHAYVAQLEQFEKSISLSVVEAETLTKELHLACESARLEGKEIASMMEETEALKQNIGSTQHSAKPSTARSTMRSASSRSASGRASATSALSPEDAHFSTKPRSRRAAEWIPAEEPSDISESYTPKRQERTPSGAQALQDLYQRAESLLKQGENLESVSRATQLPVEGVRRLAEMIEIEREEARSEPRARRDQKSSSDPRLGALGTGRRQDSQV
jgi:hypothetical protein